jgi:hypothetical protein
VAAKAAPSAVDGNEDGDGDDETEQTVILRQKVQRLQVRFQPILLCL